MAKNVIESDFRVSKMADVGYFVKKNGFLVSTMRPIMY